MADDVCLQCEQSRAEVKANKTFCGLVEGYEYQELVAEWDRHHWRDWSDKELAGMGVLPEAFDKHRRTTATAMPWIPCGDRVWGHSPAKATYEEYGLTAGQCTDCGHKDPMAAAFADPVGRALVQKIHDRKAGKA